MLVTWGAARAFSPEWLFANGEQGWVYDPSNLSTLFQDAAGTTPVTAMEQPVGLQLDLSGRGNHRRQTTSANRPVVSARVNLFVGTETLATQTVTTRATTQTLTFTGSGSITLTGTATGTYTAGTHSITTTAGSLVATVIGTVTQADIRASNMGVGLPAYQRVNTSTDYDSAGFPVYIKPNGSNQFMVTNSINFSATDKMTVWAGVRKLSDAALGMFSELGTGSGAGRIYLGASPSGSNYITAYAGSGTQYALIAPTSYPAPITNVTTVSADIAAPNISLEINSSATSSSTSVGTGNFGNYPVYFYMRAGASLPFNGHDYGSIGRGASSSAAEIASAKTWINQRTKAY